MQVDKSFLSTLSQNHVWLFGALAELLHNSSDAGSTDLQINVREEEGKEGGKEEKPVLKESLTVFHEEQEHEQEVALPGGVDVKAQDGFSEVPAAGGAASAGAAGASS